MSRPTLSNVAWDGRTALWKGRACHQTPDDLWNLAECLWALQPRLVVEVGTGDGGTSTFLQALDLPVITVDLDDPVPLIGPRTCVLLDADVYSFASVSRDLDRYSPQAQWLVVCHTIRPDWGAAPAVAAWWPAHPEWTALSVRHPTRHTWLTR